MCTKLDQEFTHVLRVRHRSNVQFADEKEGEKMHTMENTAVQSFYIHVQVCFVKHLLNFVIVIITSRSRFYI